MNTELKVSELLELETELVGVRDQKLQTTIYKGLLQQKLSGDKKYDLLELWEDVLVPNKKNVDSIKNDLIKELGTENEAGNFEIPQFIQEPGTQEEPDQLVPNPAHKEFMDRMQEVLDKIKSFECAEFKKEEVLTFSAEEIYPIFSKLLRLIKKQSK